MYSSFFVAIELSPTRNRTAVGILPGIFYGLAVAVFALEGYFLPDWRYLNLLAATPCVIIVPLSL